MTIQSENPYVAPPRENVYAAQAQAPQAAEQSPPQTAEAQAGSTGTASVYAPPSTGSQIDTYA